MKKSGIIKLYSQTPFVTKHSSASFLEKKKKIYIFLQGYTITDVISYKKTTTAY